MDARDSPCHPLARVVSVSEPPLGDAGRDRARICRNSPDLMIHTRPTLIMSHVCKRLPSVRCYAMVRLVLLAGPGQASRDRSMHQQRTHPTRR